MLRYLAFALSLSVFLAPNLIGQVDPTPVVLINGYQIPPCDKDPSTATFGQLEARLTALGRPVIWFNNCAVPPPPPALRPSIEQMASALGEQITALEAPEVDVVVHSMGGLILRSFLSGKQPNGVGFRPPANPKVRRAIFLSTPNHGPGFGPLLQIFGGSDPQVRQLLPGSSFLWDLARWNQNGDDLRGIDALAVAGDPVAYLNAPGIMDGLVPIPSAALPYPNDPARLRLLPYCHTDSGLLAQLSASCARPPYIANINGDDHLSWQIIRSFLNGTADWRTIGRAGTEALNAQLGLTAMPINPDGTPQPPPTTLTINGLETSRGEIATYREVAPRQNAWTLQLADGKSVTIPVRGAYTNGTFLTTETAGPRPSIDAVIPSAGWNGRYVLAPGSSASLYGSSLANATLALEGTALPAQFTSDRQINFVLPETLATNYPNLLVRTATTSQTLRLLLHPAAPAIFTDPQGLTPAWEAISGATRPFRAGDIIAFYATGLGATTARGGLLYSNATPTIEVNGQPATVLFAGRAPGLATLGIDQINIILPTDIVPSGQSTARVRLSVSSAGITSNEALLSVSR